LITVDPKQQFVLVDSEGYLDRLLHLLDGSRTTYAVAVEMQAEWPNIDTDDVCEAVNALDALLLLEDSAAVTTLAADDQERYFSNLAFFGTYADLTHSRYSFQEQLGNSRVVLLGVGGLGSTVLYNLLGMGVGSITILDCDVVAARNLARQFLYSEAEIGQPKVGCATQRASAYNSSVPIEAVERMIQGPADLDDIVPGADLVICGVDQPAAVVFWVNEACVKARVPFITGGMQVSRAMYVSVDPGRSSCLECLKVREAKDGDATSLAASLVRVNRGIAPVATMAGALVAMEALRFLTKFAPPISAGCFRFVDFATGIEDEPQTWDREPECPVCGLDSPLTSPKVRQPTPGLREMP
jgi:molybdopterin/thiamine biosynthesis adenylyltransferase